MRKKRKNKILSEVVVMAMPGRKPKGKDKAVKREIYLSPDLDKFIQELIKQKEKKGVRASYSGMVCLIIQKWRVSLMKTESRAEHVEPQTRFQTIEELNQFLTTKPEDGGYEFGHESLTIEGLLKDYGRLREFNCAARNVINVFDDTDWRKHAYGRMCRR